MDKANSYSQPSGTAGLLARLALRRRLTGGRLVSVAALVEVVEEVAYLARLLDLCQFLWGEFPPEVEEAARARDTWHLERLVVSAVHESHFPLDLDLLDEWANSGEERLLGGSLWVEGWGVGWNLGRLQQVASPDQPLVAACFAHAPLALWEERELWEADLAAWWQAHGYTPVPALTWPADRAWASRMLAVLPPPLDGLAVLHEAVMRETDNPFLTYAPGDWESHEGFEFGWERASLMHLAALWQATKPRLARLAVYRAWAEAEPEASQYVADQLVRLEEAYSRQRPKAAVLQWGDEGRGNAQPAQPSRAGKSGNHNATSLALAPLPQGTPHAFPAPPPTKKRLVAASCPLPPPPVHSSTFGPARGWGVGGGHCGGRSL